MKPFLFTALVTCALGVLGAAACGNNETPPPLKPAYDGGVGSALPCVPNLDGKIESRELVPQVGIAATYLVSPPGKDRPVDLLGQTNPQGKLTWAFGNDYIDDQVAQLAAQQITGKWYAGAFAAVSNPVIVSLDVAGRVEGVYTQTTRGSSSTASPRPWRTRPRARRSRSTRSPSCSIASRSSPAPRGRPPPR